MTTVATYPDLAGKVAVVTGGSRGIGAETCRQLAANGVLVAVGGRDEETAQRLVKEIRTSGGTAVTALAECTDPEQLESMREAVERELGPADVLCAFAGGDSGPRPFDRMDLDEWKFRIDLNLTSAFLTFRTFVPGMCARGRGSVITMSSAAGRQAGWSSPAYAAAKGGVTMLTKHLACEVGPSGVRVNSIAPSAVLTGENDERIPEDYRPVLIKEYPIRRLGVPGDVAAAALFLASSASSWVTGQTIDVSGGKVMILFAVRRQDDKEIILWLPSPKASRQ